MDPFIYTRKVANSIQNATMSWYENLQGPTTKIKPVVMVQSWRRNLGMRGLFFKDSAFEDQVFKKLSEA